MPKERDDFDEFEDGYDDVEEIDDDVDEYEDEPVDPEIVEPQVVRRRPNRAQRRSQKRGATTVPANAPRPKDRLAKKSARQTEVEDVEIVLTLWDEELRIDRAAMVNSWDFQEGAVNKNPLQMVKGLLGAKQFGWFCMKARGENLSPFEAANQLMNLFAEEGGFGELGNS